MALHQLRMTAFKRTSGRSASVPRRRRPPPERHMPADPLGSRVRRLAFPFSLAVTGGIPFGFLFLRSMICLSSAGALARFQVETVVFSSERPSCLGLATRPYEISPGLVPTSATVERRSQRPNPSRGGKRPHAFQRPDATPGTDRLLSRRSSTRSITRAAESSVLSIRGHAACTDGETRCRDETRPSATSVSETVEASSPVPFIVRPWNGRARGVILRGHHVRSTCRRSVRPAIHVPSRGSPRSSSTGEPSDPPFGAIYTE